MRPLPARAVRGAQLLLLLVLVHVRVVASVEMRANAGTRVSAAILARPEIVP